MNKFWKISGIILLVIVLACIYFYFKFAPAKSYTWGLTFSYQEAQGLGFDWKTMYLDILSDLKPKNLRLMTYWDDIEKTQGKYDFSIVDQEVQEAQKQNVNVILVVGRKQPRWPECHEPDWYNSLSTDQQEQAILDLVTQTIDHFKSYGNITQWQVENEPYFGFGPDCSKSSPDLLKAEVTTVKKLDSSRPVLVTDSGDRGSWTPIMKSGADNFGFTLYRVSNDSRYGGYYKYPLPPAFYRIRAGILETFTHVNQISDMELQMEPWFTNGAFNTPLNVQDALMNPKIFAQNIAYAESTGIGTHYLWGVEWWYWMAKKNNDWGMWNSAKDLFNM